MAAAVIVAINPLKRMGQARDAQRKNDIGQLATVFKEYLALNGTYPSEQAPVPGCPNTNDIADWSSHPCWPYLLPNGYIKIMPVDPKNTDLGNCQFDQNCHLYHYCRPTPDRFVLIVNLENEDDPQIRSAPIDCASGGPNNYWVDG